MKLTKKQITGLFEFPQNKKSLSDILKQELNGKVKIKKNKTLKKVKKNRTKVNDIKNR